jgi:hypothetical protein
MKNHTKAIRRGMRKEEEEEEEEIRVTTHASPLE